MTPGEIVLVDWRDALPASGEPNKRRPAIVVGDPRVYNVVPFKLVVPLTGDVVLTMPGATLAIEPTPENGCTKTSFAISWSVQAVPDRRITLTSSKITSDELEEIRAQIAVCASLSE